MRLLAKRPGPFRVDVKGRVGSLLAMTLVALIYVTAWLLARLRRRLAHAPLHPVRRLAVIGTFYNRGWFVAHATPLARCGVEEVLVVTDEPQVPVERVRVLCPPRWAVSLVGRTIAKFVCLLGAGLRDRPDFYMGYHIMPGAIMALLAGRVFGRPVCYQMTGGPNEIVGGGAGSENPVLRRLGQSRPRLEALAVRVVRQFDHVVVRGKTAQRFLVERGVAENAIAIIPGSVAPTRVEPIGARTHDLVFVGRLAEVKQPLQFIEIFAAVRRAYPSANALVVGDGPLMSAMRDRAAALGVPEHVGFAGKTDRVENLLARARIFVLTSRTEGLSIAMAEAMMAGVVPVVANVGDLGDLVRDGINGYLVAPDDIDAYVGRIRGILNEPQLWSRLSASATASAQCHVGLDHVTALWREQLQRV
jgi:glycosyltransferase involved in cell wall biosynthesis